MSESHKIDIPVNVRFLMHLLEYTEFKRVYAADNAVTQSGIAEAIGIRKEHVSRTAKELITEKFVYCRTSHIQG